jgi:hypothetical protein
LVARPFEVARSLRNGLPREAVRFSPSPAPITYCLYNPDDYRLGRRWMRQYQVFYLPRPWWGWIGRISASERPIEPAWPAGACALLLALGSTLLVIAYHGSRLEREHEGRRISPPLAGALDGIP